MELLTDTHVHVHLGFDPGRLLDAAAANFDRAAPGLSAAERLDVLCLTDVRGRQTDQYFCETLRQAGAWRFSCAVDRDGVCAERPDGRRLHWLPGRQIVSKENLELLALACRYEPEDRALDLSALIDAVRDHGGVPVVPWGFGKWTGDRGRIVQRLVETRDDFLLADNGNRRRGSAFPALLEAGRRKGLGILAGSDPLPLPAQDTRTGSYGVRAPLPQPDLSPAEAFRAAIRSRAWTIYGQLTPPGAFWIGQVRMQIAKRWGR